MSDNVSDNMSDNMSEALMLMIQGRAHTGRVEQDGCQCYEQVLTIPRNSFRCGPLNDIILCVGHYGNILGVGHWMRWQSHEFIILCKVRRCAPFHCWCPLTGALLAATRIRNTRCPLVPGHTAWSPAWDSSCCHRALHVCMTA